MRCQNVSAHFYMPVGSILKVFSQASQLHRAQRWKVQLHHLYASSCFPAGAPAKEQRTFTSASSMATYLGREGLLGSPGLSEDTAQQRVAFVFGREVEGLMLEEVAACSAACQLPMGRLQESLSLTHAIAIAMSAAFEGAMAANGGKE